MAREWIMLLECKFFMQGNNGDVMLDGSKPWLVQPLSITSTPEAGLFGSRFKYGIMFQLAINSVRVRLRMQMLDFHSC